MKDPRIALLIAAVCLGLGAWLVGGRPWLGYAWIGIGVWWLVVGVRALRRPREDDR